jgi:hypothetical protein
LEGAAAPDSGGRGAGWQVAAWAWSPAGVCPGVLSPAGRGTAAAGCALRSLGSLSVLAVLELPSSLAGVADESKPWSPGRPGTGRERVKKKRDLAAGASGLASFPRFFPLASSAALVSIVLEEEVAALSFGTLIPRSTVNTNINSGDSTSQEIQR